MRKFSNQVKINESSDDTFVGNKKIGEFPDYWNDILDTIEVFKETNSEDVHNLQVSIGYCPDKSLDRMKSAQTAQLIGMKRAKELFPSGVIPDKWNLCIRLNIGLVEIPGISDNLYSGPKFCDMETFDVLIRRLTIVKTLYKRLSRRGSVKMSFLNGGINGSKRTGSGSQTPNICIMLVLD